MDDWRRSWELELAQGAGLFISASRGAGILTELREAGIPARKKLEAKYLTA